MPAAVRELMQRCWAAEPRERPSFGEIVTLLAASCNEWATRRPTRRCHRRSSVVQLTLQLRRPLGQRPLLTGAALASPSSILAAATHPTTDS